MNASHTPQSAIIVGAGMVGLATAWHLQERGVEVTVLDRTGVAAGSSWGNAGWLTPGMAMPLSDPTLWSYGLKALFDPSAPLHIPIRVDPKLWKFLALFAGQATQKKWDHAMAALTPIDRIALDSFDEFAAAGITARTHEGPFIIGFEKEKQAAGFLHEIRHVESAGQSVPVTPLENPREKVPQLSAGVSSVYEMAGQRFIEPGPYVEDLARAVRERGGKILTGVTVTGVKTVSAGGVRVESSDGGSYSGDVAVLATGAWLPGLAKPLGVRTLIQAGRGYSFSVPTDQPAQYPIYFPARRVACTPYEGRLRIAGTMEFRGPDEALQSRRIDAILASVRPLFQNMDLEDRKDEWVGSRPVTPDGLPVIGATRAPGVYVAGGHGMWGIVLGPATGKLLAEQIMTGVVPRELRSFDPLR